MTATQMNTGVSTISVSTTTNPLDNGQVGSTCVTDPTSGQKCNVFQFHNADNQVLGTAYAINTGGVAQLLNASNNLDRQREAGLDGVPSAGIASGAASFAMGFKTSIAASVTASASAQAVTPGAMSGTVGGVAWSIQVGSTIIVDTGASLENVTVTAVTATTFSAIFTKNHTGPFTIRGFVFNMERDAAGEADGATGIGTAVAAEYEYNGGAPGGGNFDRARSIQGKGRTTTTVSSGGTQNSTSIVVGAAGTLKAGMQILLYDASFPTAGHYETVYVDAAYSEGSTTVPLASAIVNATTYTNIAYDAFSAMGPGLNGFNATGIGIEGQALYDSVTGLFYIGRAAPGAAGVAAVSTESVKATYSLVVSDFTPAATATDIFVLPGSASKTIRVTNVRISGDATAAASLDLYAYKRTAANTGGTTASQAANVTQHDGNDAAASAVPVTYTANATGLGTGTLVRACARQFFPAAGTPALTNEIIWDFTTRNSKAIVLRGTAQSFALNLGGQAIPAGLSLYVTVEWSEE